MHSCTNKFSLQTPFGTYHCFFLVKNLASWHMGMFSDEEMNSYGALRIQMDFIVLYYTFFLEHAGITLKFVSLLSSIHAFFFSCSTIVKFSVRELSEVKRVSSHHLRLLGFKPLDCLKDYHNLRPSSFIYPSDEVVCSSGITLVSSCSLLMYCCYPLNAENVFFFPCHLASELQADNTS